MKTAAEVQEMIESIQRQIERHAEEIERAKGQVKKKAERGDLNFDMELRYIKQYQEAIENCKHELMALEWVIAQDI